ncbi:uncharacterized protein J7T54_002767 [Emericellopsis cladophorae]|uniref:Uncharacterized protein n=1 Tax=Emericellopsis cladophorae TaxID=2686198 RepID=A0A9P9XU68_9HYPO|nr:uncharacterized protein J7T54_002767 [Emericellopsis cladophorae]KAI6777633.1 hypothetical protein J7T54_002767 [Emericellopsis cladophorae]
MSPPHRSLRDANEYTTHHADFVERFTQREKQQRTWKINSEGTSWEYWRQYKQLYSSVTGKYVDRNDSREVLKWHDAYLVPKYSFRPPNIDGKPVLGPDDLLVLQTFNIAYDTGIFTLERQRIQLSGSYLILGCTGARPAEVVDNEKNKPRDGSWEELWGGQASLQDDDAEAKSTDEVPDKNSRLLEDILSQESEGRGRPKALCYKDVSLIVVRHPDTNEDVLAMAIKFIHHKGSHSKPKPTIFFFIAIKRLIFCPILAIISLALDDEAFDAPSLTTAERVFRIKSRGPVQCTHLRWKQKWLERPIFRGFDGSSTSEEKALPYYKLRDDMERQTLDAGFEEPIGPKGFRRGAANAANGKAPNAVRDQVMRHDPKWATFNSAYINEKVEFHLQNAFLDEPMEDGLIKFFTHISIMRDPRASYDMVPEEVWRTLPPDPDIAALEAQRGVRRLSNKIRNKRAQRNKALRQEHKKYYFYNRPTWDIEKQTMNAFEDDEEEEDGGAANHIQPPIELRIPERARLAEILCHHPDNLNRIELRRLRIEATQLMTALCSKKETVRQIMYKPSTEFV